MNGSNIYEGQFHNDMHHGFGRYIYQNGGYYIGEYKNGVRCGSGLYVDEKGNRFDKFFVGNWAEKSNNLIDFLWNL